jgi:hypothetical protein
MSSEEGERTGTGFPWCDYPRNDLILQQEGKKNVGNEGYRSWKYSNLYIFPRCNDVKHVEGLAKKSPIRETWNTSSRAIFMARVLPCRCPMRSLITSGNFRSHHGWWWLLFSSIGFRYCRVFRTPRATPQPGLAWHCQGMGIDACHAMQRDMLAGSGRWCKTQPISLLCPMTWLGLPHMLHVTCYESHAATFDVSINS